MLVGRTVTRGSNLVSKRQSVGNAHWLRSCFWGIFIPVHAVIVTRFVKFFNIKFPEKRFKNKHKNSAIYFPQYDHDFPLLWFRALINEIPICWKHKAIFSDENRSKQLPSITFQKKIFGQISKYRVSSSCRVTRHGTSISVCSVKIGPVDQGW